MDRYPSSALFVPLYLGVSLLKLNIMKKGALGNLAGGISLTKPSRIPKRDPPYATPRCLSSLQPRDEGLGLMNPRQRLMTNTRNIVPKYNVGEIYY